MYEYLIRLHFNYWTIIVSI